MINFYLQNEYGFAAVQLILAMLGMGATLTAKDFRDVFREPLAVSMGTAMQLLMVPLVAAIFLGLGGITGGAAIGIALIAAIPGGTVSNIYTYLARGNSALSISITAITTLACLLTTPLILSLLIASDLPANFVMPAGSIVAEIGLTLLLPLLLGMAYLYFYPRSALRFSNWCIRGSLLGILCIVVGSLAAGRLDINAFGRDNVLLLLAFALVLAVAAYVLPLVFRLSAHNATAIEMEVIVRNVNLGVLLKASLFPANNPETAALGDMVLFSLLLYGGVQMLIGAGVIALRRRGIQ